MSGFGKARQLIKTLLIVATITFLEAQVIGWIIVQMELHSNPRLLQFFDFSFNEKALPPGKTINYKEHHYLNYILNPAAKYMGTRQFNSEFNIRRTEIIRDRKQVTWRGLALGGSTTFGEQLADEKDTWVWKSEKLLRNIKGEGVDLINGGVGGYTTEENIIHYVTLLTHLNPDLVLLYVGINDVHPRLIGTIRPDYSNYRKPWRSAGQIFEPANTWLSPFWLYSYYFVQTHYWQNLDIGTVTTFPYPDSSAWQEALERNSAKIFESNLRNLVTLIISQGRSVVIIPQYFQVLSQSDAIFSIGVNEHNEIC